MSDLEWEERVRNWQKAWEKWTLNGRPENDKNSPKPGPHPQNDHEWNLDEESYIQKHCGEEQQPAGDEMY